MMTKFNPAIHNRRSIRRKGYDYAQEGVYYISLCCQDRACIFGEIKDEEMVLNGFGEIARNEWLNTPNIRKNIELHEFVIMPNHIHGIIEILTNVKENSEENIGKFKSPSQTVGAIVRGYKIATIKKIKDYLKENKEDNRDVTRGELQFAPSYVTTKTILNLNFKIWQRNYFERIIWDQRSYENISDYIINNPKNWNEDKLRT